LKERTSKSKIDVVMSNNPGLFAATMLLTGLLAGSTAVSAAGAQTAAPAAPPAPATQTAPKPAPAPAARASRYHPNRFSKRAELHYSLIWGVDDLAVKWTESGEVVRFSYRILDATKAKALNDKKNSPVLNDPKAGVQLVVPSLEKVGQLRQSSTPEEGKTYWMAFSNKGRLVKRGDHVNVVIGPFRADGLVVD
jgi:hypothetical protein